MPKFSCSLCPISAALVICVRCRLPNRRLLTTGCGALGLYGRTPERYTSFGLGAILVRALARSPRLSLSVSARAFPLSLAAACAHEPNLIYYDQWIARNVDNCLDGASDKVKVLRAPLGRQTLAGP